MEELGTLVLRLVFDDSGFSRDASKAARNYERATDSIGVSTVALGNIVANAFTAASRAVSQFVTDTASVGAGFQRQIDVVGAISNSTDADLQRLASTARELGRQTEFTATQTGEALQVLAQAGKDANESIELLPRTLAFAQAQSTGLAQATELLISTTNTFARQQVQAAEASDLFTRATQTTQLNFSRLQESLKFAGPSAAAFNVSLEETVAVLGALADQGLQGSLAGTVFRETLNKATTQTEQQAAALKRLGLEFDDINPQINGFVGVVENIGAANIDAQTAIEIFGRRAGPVIANLARSAAVANGELRGSIDTLANSAGATEQQVQRVTDNVVGSFREVVSQFQDLQIELFDTFSEPLQGALDAVIPFIEGLTESLSEVSGVVGDNLQQALEVFTDTAQDSGDSIADAFANAAVSASALVREVAPLVRLVASLVPLFDDVAFAVGTAFVASKVSSFARAIALLPGALSAASAAMAAFGTATTVATGGLAALAGGLAVVLSAVAVYVNTLGKARRATESLREAQEAAADSSRRQAAALADQLGPILERSQRLARERLETAENLTEAQREELRTLADLTREQAVAQAAIGKLVVVEGRLRTVQGLLADGSAEQADNLRTLADASSEAADSAQNQADRIGELLQAYDAGRSSLILTAATLREQFPDIAASLSDPKAYDEAITLARQKLIELRQAQEDEAAKAVNISRALTEARRKALDEQVSAAIEGEDTITKEAAKQAEERRKIAEAAAAAIRAAFEQGQAEFASLTSGPIEEARRNTDEQIAIVQSNLRTFLENFAGAEEERARIVSEAQGAIGQIRENEAEQIRQLEQDAAAQRIELARATEETIAGFVGQGLDERQQVVQQRGAALLALEEQGLAEREQIVRDFADQLLGIEDQDDRVRLVDARTRELAALEQRLADGRVAIKEEADRRILDIDRATFRQLLQGPGFLQRSFKDAFDSITANSGEAFQAAAKGAADAGKFIAATTSVFTAGATFGLQTIQSLVQEIISEIKTAEDAVLSTQEKLAEAREEFAELVSESTEELRQARDSVADSFTVAVPPEIERARERLQEAADEVQAAKDELAEAERRLASGEAARAAAEAFGDEIEFAIGVFAESVDDIIFALIQSAPDIAVALVKGIIESAPAIGTAIGEAILSLIPGLGGKDGKGGKGGKTTGSKFLDDLSAFLSGGIVGRDPLRLRKRARAAKARGDDEEAARLRELAREAEQKLGLRRAIGGMSFAPSTGVTMVERGERVLTVAENRERIMNERPDRQQASPTGAANYVPTFPGGGGVLRVQIGDQQFDEFLFRADQRGGLPRSSKAGRQKTDTRVGFTPD